MQTLTLFVSSPGDVRDERQSVGRVVERLQARYWNFIRLEPVLWEKEPLRATAHFNEELIRPSDCDLFVCILWSRLGSPLPAQFNRKGGTRFDSGTEWELEEATDAFEERAARAKDKAKPDILVYRRMSEPPAGDPSQAEAKKEQRGKLEAFCERFFFNKDKTIRRVFSPYGSVDEFAKLFEQHLEKLVLKHIQLQRGLSGDAVRPSPLEGPPYMGLRAFEFQDAPLFFGRNRPIAEALAKLKENHKAGHAFLLIHGASGCGKSSLMKAGLAPRLTADGYLPEVGTWAGSSLLPVEDGAPPLETLARAITGSVPDLGKLRDTSGKDQPPAGPAARSARKKRRKPPTPAPKSAEPVWDTARLTRMLGQPEDLPFAIAAIIAALDRMSAGKPAHLLILIDQLEEIFTAREVTRAQRDHYFQVLAALAMTGRVWVVTTMRSEFFPRVPEHRDLFQLVRHGGDFILSPPEPPELHQIIRYPALAAALQFERHPESGRDLSEQIHEDAANAGEALPQLEFTLEELYQRRSGNVLTWAAYEELGGLSGTSAGRAREAFDASPPETELPLVRAQVKRKLRLFQGATVIFAGLVIGAGVLGMIARKKQAAAEVAEEKAKDSAGETRRALAAADFDAGAARVAAGSPGEALPYLLSALEGDPENLDAQALLLETLRHTAWSFPEIELQHPLPVRKLSFGSHRDTLFAATDSGSSGEGFNSTLRWDLQKTSIEAMLAPRRGETTLTLSVAPNAKRLVLQRGYKFPGDADLVDAVSMKMLARLPVTRSHKIPATCFAWSPDGLLFAYPAKTDAAGPAVSAHVWRIIDAASGKTLLETGPLAPDSAAPLASTLNRERLRVVFADGSVAEYPVNPTAAVLKGKTPDTHFDFAIFSPDGSKILTSTRHDDRGSEAAETYSVVAKPEECRLSIESEGFAAEDDWTSTAAITERFPWPRRESPFRGKVAGDAREGRLPLKIEGSRLEMKDINGADLAPRAPIRTDSQIECAAFSGSRVALGTASGQLSIHEVLPRIGHGLPSFVRAVESDGKEQDKEGWRTVEQRAGTDLQRRGHDWRLRDKDGRIVSLQPHPNWTYPMYAARPADGSFVVMGGYSSGSGGCSSAGMVVCDPNTGALRSDLEPVDEIRGLIFLGESDRVVAMASMEVIVADADKDGFRRVASLPVVDAVSIHHIASRSWIAVATEEEIHLFDERDFSRIARLPVAVHETWSGRESGVHDWTDDPRRGWLAYRRDGRLDLWSLRNNRALVSGLSVPTSRDGMEFIEKDGVILLKLAADASITLARMEGIDGTKLSALKALSESLSGMGFAKDSRCMTNHPPETRRERAAGTDRAALESLLPGTGALLDRIAELRPRRSKPEAWIPVWQRLASGRDNGPAIARWASGLGTDDAWYRAYIRGLIGDSDARLHSWQRGNPLDEGERDSSNPLPHDDNVSTYHRLAGDSESTRELKQAAWLAVRTDPAFLGKQLVEGTKPDEFEGLDLKAVEKLDPEALEVMRAGLGDGDMRDWRRVAIGELPNRAAALETLDAQVADTLAAFGREASAANAIAHAEALALRGKRDEAETFLRGKVPEDAVLDLSRTHFLIASRLSSLCEPSVRRALDTLKSPWLWKAWLDVPEGDLKDRVARVMKAVDGQGPAAVAALEKALASADAGAIGAALEQAKELPLFLREYATARAMWMQGQKAEVFALWPERIPDFQEIIAAGDWGGWEEALPWEASISFTAELSNELAKLEAPEEATVGQLQALAAFLLDPGTTAIFGIKRVRDAMVHTGLRLANDPGSAPLVTKLVDRARLGGAPHLDCLRIEARSLMAAGEFTQAYARWLALIDSDDARITSSDYLEAARCVIEDMQDAAAIQLLMRGKEKYPEDPAYVFDSAWLLLTTGHPEEAGVMLEHGFTIPFTEEQKQVSIAMLVCAAEQTQRSDRADEAFTELIALAKDWGSEESIKSLKWPESLTQSLLAVARRNRS